MKFCTWIVLTVFAFPAWVSAASFDLPARGDDIVGSVKTYTVKEGDNFFKIAQRFDVGYYNLKETNPGIDANYIEKNTMLIMPTEYILPNAPREGMIINVAEMRLYYFPKDEKKVYVYPVGIGREGTGTPLGYMSIVEHMKDPTWHAPKSIIEARAKDGVIIPKIVPPGPNNPLGKYAMRLSKRTYLIHGTNDSTGVGRRSSAGCIRMYPKDIDELFHKVENGTQVLVINNPVKVGRHQNRIYLEAHLPLHEFQDEASELELKKYVGQLLRGIVAQLSNRVKWEQLMTIVLEEQGIPQVIIQTAS